MADFSSLNGYNVKDAKARNDIEAMKTSVVDNLSSDDAKSPLSANQGKVLNENKISKTDVVDNLLSESENLPLSANQGRILNEAVTQLNGNMLQAISCTSEDVIVPAYEEGTAYLYPDIPTDCKIVTIIPGVTGAKGILYEGHAVNNQRNVTVWFYNATSEEKKIKFFCYVLYKVSD